MHYEKFADGSVKCIEDEIPFELPDGWAWARIGTICIINPRNNIADDLEVSFIPMPMISEGYVNTHTYEVRIWNNVKSGFTHFAENDIGIAKITPCFENRKSVIFKKLVNGYGAGTTELHILRTLDGTISNEYLLWIAKMESFIQGGVQTFSGAVGQQRVGKDFFSQYLIPIPPHNEQIRIVNKINLIFNFVITMENEKSSLHETIKQAKSKILDLAIRGQLVPQNSDDEPASVLLERIRAEKEELIKQGKIKRDKKESVIFKGEDNSYYDEIPDGWSEIALKDVCEVRNGYAFKSSNFSQNGTPIIRISDIQNETISIEECVYWNQEVDKRFVIEKGDLLIAMSGATTGKMGVYKSDLPAYLNQRVGNVRIKDDTILCVGYRDIYLRGMQDFILKNAYGGAQPNISSKFIEDIQILLPPYNEQLRIVETVKILFQILNTIEKSLL